MEREDEPEGSLSLIEKAANGFRAAFAMFSILPVKNVDWKEKNLAYMLVFFPLVGWLIALCSISFSAFGTWLGFQPAFQSILLVLLPVLVTGGIHVDGLMDTQDALSSWQGRDRRLEILKDSHVGAFGVMKAICFFLAEIAAFSELIYSLQSVVMMGLCYVASRCLSALIVVTLPKAKKEGTVAAFSRGSESRAVKLFTFIHLGILFLIGLFISPALCLLLACFSLGFYAWFRKMTLTSFGGVTGDLNGFFVCYYELGCSLGLAIGGRLLPVLVRMI